MNRPGLLSPDDETLIGRLVLARRAKVFNERVVASAVTSPLGTILLAWVEAKATGWERAVAWLLLINLIELLLIAIGYRFRLAQSRGEAELPWAKRMIFAVFLTGLGWGSTVWIFWTEGQYLYYLLNLAVLVSVSGICVVIMSPFRMAMTLFTAGILLLPTLHLAFVPNPFGLEVATGLAILFVLVLQYGRVAEKQLTGGLENAARNERLVDELAHRAIVLENTQAELNRAQAVGNVGSWAGDIASDTMRLSAEACRILDLPEGRTQNFKSYLARTFAQDRDGVDRAWQDALKGAVLDHEHRIVIGSETRWVRQKAELEFAADGTPLTVVGIVQDTTERKESEAKIRRLSNLYAALSQCNRAVVYCPTEKELLQNICDALVNFGNMKMAWVGVVDVASRRVAPVAFSGNNTEYLEGVEISVDPDDPAGRGPTGIAIRENRPYWCQDFLHDACTEGWQGRGAAAGWRASAAVPLFRGGTAIGALSIYASEVNAFDETTRELICEIAANITFALDHFKSEMERQRTEAALRESETRLSVVFQASPIGIAIFRLADGKVLEVNDAALRLYGYTRDEVIGHTADELAIYITPDERKELLRRIRESGRVDRLPVNFRASGGEIGVLEVSGCATQLQGEPCLLVMLFDVTERKRLEETHLQAQKLESLGTLAGGIAHDFNNILAAIHGNVDLAVADAGPEHIAAASLREIKKASTRASDLVRRIMAFGRPKEAQHAVVDLGAVVNEVLKLLRSTLNAGIALRTDFAKETPHALADPGQVHEVIVNLTTNAAYAIGPRAGLIEYRLQRIDVDRRMADSIPGLTEGCYARLTVTDTGCGMDEATMERIFDAFYTTKPVGEGTGLGLSMVHGTMKSLDGAVTVESAPGRGSSFALYFPAAQTRAAKEEAIAKVAVSSTTGRRVLFVDDEEALVLLASRALSRLGHKVSGFTSPEEALEAFRERPQDFDAVVTDLSMPHMSGYELAREVLALRPGMPVLMTTGYIRAEDEHLAHEAGILELILKPATMDELGRVLDETLRDSEPKGERSA